MRTMTIKDFKNIINDPENNIQDDSVINYLEMNINTKFKTADSRKAYLNTKITINNLSATVNSSMTFEMQKIS